MVVPWYAIFAIGVVVGAMALWIVIIGREGWQIIKDLIEATKGEDGDNN